MSPKDTIDRLSGRDDLTRDELRALAGARREESQSGLLEQDGTRGRIYRASDGTWFWSSGGYLSSGGYSTSADVTSEHFATREEAEADFGRNAAEAVLSLLPLDVGFCPRATGQMVHLGRSLRLRVRYLDRQGSPAEVAGKRVDVVRALRGAGYGVRGSVWPCSRRAR